jgi:UDP-N-acetylglucosamine 4,6-dehydratase
MIFTDRTILVTGGTGSFGKVFIKRALKEKFRKVIVFSRHEQLQVEMQREYEKEKRIRFFIGDIRDKERLSQAFKNVDYIIHAAALKHVDMCQYNPLEAVKTNVHGTENIIDVAIEREVRKVLAISTDKAVMPVNLYGAVKLTSDFLFLTSNVYSDGSTKFSVVRFGNFWGSRGSVVELFFNLNKQKKKEFPITDMRMKRYFIDLERAAEFALFILSDMKGKEVYVPQMKERLISEIAKEIQPKIKLCEIGCRPGEKLREDLIPECELNITKDFGNYWKTVLK